MSFVQINIEDVDADATEEIKPATESKLSHSVSENLSSLFSLPRVFPTITRVVEPRAVNFNEPNRSASICVGSLMHQEYDIFSFVTCSTFIHLTVNSFINLNPFTAESYLNFVSNAKFCKVYDGVDCSKM